MRADLPGNVAAVVARAARPSLVFDLARIDDNLAALAAAARGVEATVLFAAKSFPHAAVRTLAAARLAGFDVASEGELAELADLPAVRVLSIVDPTGRAGAAARAERVIVGCETVEQVAAAPVGAEIAIRISASITGRDPAVGAILDGSGHRRSRFGVERAADVRALARAAGGRPVGLHVHHGPVAATTGERFVATARAALALAADAELAPRFLDLGGAWHAIADVALALAKVRAAVPAAVELVLEPGRAFANGAGFATGRVVVARDALRVSDLSRICHLRWSHVELVGPAPRPGRGERLLVAGATCFEEDVLGEWSVEPERLAVGERIVLRGVTGYAVAWNAGFGGVPPADVIMV